jgi:hypothetical protein
MKHPYLIRALFGGCLFALGCFSIIGTTAILPFWNDYSTLSGWALTSQAIVDGSYLLAYLLLTIAGGFLLFDKGNKQRVVDALFLAFGLVSLFGYFFDYATIIAFYTSQSNGEGIVISLPLHAVLPFSYVLLIGVILEAISFFKTKNAKSQFVLRAIGEATSLFFYIEYLLYWGLLCPNATSLYKIVVAVGAVLLFLSYVTLIVSLSVDHSNDKGIKQIKN